MNFMKKVWAKFLDKYFWSDEQSHIIAIRKKYAYWFSMMEDINYETFLKIKKLEEAEIERIKKIFKTKTL